MRRNPLHVLLILGLVAGMFGGSAAAASNAPEREEVLIGFHSEHVTPADVQVVRGAGGSVEREFNLIPTVLAEVPAPAVEALEQNPRVRYVEPNGEVWALDEADIPWGVDRVDAPEVWDEDTPSSTGAGVSVAVLDTGIDVEHPDLDVADCTNTVDNTGCGDDHDDGGDGSGHGTHVAGTVAADRFGNTVAGVAPGVTLYDAKVLGDDGSGSWESVAAGIEWAVDEIDAPTVVNMSLGGDSDSDTLSDMAEAARDEGALLVAAAGNSGNPPGRGDNVGYPARYESVIAVAATDENDNRASFSSTGPDVELAAPGVDIESTVPGGGTDTYNGTSMASPHVAGVAALAWAANAELSNADVRGILRDTAVDLGSSDHYGDGLVNAPDAVGAASDEDPSEPVEPEPSVTITSPEDGSEFEVGDEVTFEGEATSGDDDLTDDIGWNLAGDELDATGGSVTVEVQDSGDYMMTATVEDGDTVAEDSITIQVTDPEDDNGDEPPEGEVTVSVQFDGWSTPGPHLRATVIVVDGEGNGVEGADVTATLEGANNSYKNTETETTGSDGSVTLQFNHAGRNGDEPFTLYIDDVSGDGIEWGDELDDGRLQLATYEDN